MPAAAGVRVDVDDAIVLLQGLAAGLSRPDHDLPQHVPAVFVDLAGLLLAHHGYRGLIGLGLEGLAGHGHLTFVDVEPVAEGEQVVDDPRGVGCLGGHAEDAAGRARGHDHLVGPGGFQQLLVLLLAA